jgi:hypothetical protein
VIGATWTPWGIAQSRTDVGDGILCVSTASHGGYFVPDRLLGRIPAEGQAFAARWSGSPNWFEEDCAWAYVALAFPEFFPADALADARRIVGNRAV